MSARWSEWMTTAVLVDTAEKCALVSTWSIANSPNGVGTSAAFALLGLGQVGCQPEFDVLCGVGHPVGQKLAHGPGGRRWR